MNQPLTNTQALSQKIEGRLDPAAVSELTLTNAAGGLNLENMSQVMDLAKMMAISDVAVRKHLRNNPGACLAVAVQAFEWKMSPFAVANKSYVVNDQLAYEAQLIQAVITMRAPIVGRVKSEYSGEGQDRRIKVWAQTTDLETVEYLSPRLGDIKPQNSPLWKNDPDQQLHYFAVRSWCRRHFPDVILGVYARDELEDAGPMRDVSPSQPAGTGLAGRLAAKQASSSFSAETVSAELVSKEQASTDVASPGLDEPASVDWNNRDEAIRSIKAGVMPAGYSRGDKGELIVPADESMHIEGHSMVMSLFSEIRSSSGAVLKTKSPPTDEQPDPEVLRDAASKALSGAEREAPEGINEAQTKFWLAKFDEVLADAEANG